MATSTLGSVLTRRMNSWMTQLIKSRQFHTFLIQYRSTKALATLIVLPGWGRMYSRGCSSQKPKPEAAESACPYAVLRLVMSAPAGSIPRSSHPSGSQPDDPAPSRYRPTPVYPLPKPSEMP
ncbi:hypothetical protein Tco_0154909 [Tanacetum coccineum]